MTAHKHTVLLLGLLGLLGSFALACSKNSQVAEVNVQPVARAWVADVPFPEDAAVRPAAIVPAEGATVEVTLDASRSTDSDGKIASYRWLSAAVDPDGGAGRIVPMGEGADWPKDEQKPVVTLERGFHRFSLWVTDDDGDISVADVLTVQVGEEEMLTPDEQACFDDVFEMVPDDCKTCICKQSATCREDVVESACDETCWGLINCIALMCPDFTTMAAAGDFSCLIANCGMFSAGGMAAQGAGACATACVDSCRGMEVEMP